MAVPPRSDQADHQPTDKADFYGQLELDEVGAVGAAARLPTPTRNPKHLPLSELEPEEFERLVAEYVHLRFVK